VREDVGEPLMAGELLFQFPAVQDVGGHELFVFDLAAKFKWQQTRYVEVVDPEERHMVTDVVHRQRDVHSHSECRS